MTKSAIRFLVGVLAVGGLSAAAGCGTPTTGDQPDTGAVDGGGVGDGGDAARGDAGADTGATPDTGMMTPDTGMMMPDMGAMMPDMGTDAGPIDLCMGVDCSTMSDMCNVGMCNPADGTCMAVPMADGTACDDGDACTTTDVCGAGHCGGAAMDCSSLDDQCNMGLCDATSGTCVASPLAAGTSCDDGDACTTMDVCGAGSCAGTALDCSGSADMCNAGICSMGACMASPLPAGTACTTGNVCSWRDACGAGSCSGTIGDCNAMRIVVPNQVGTSTIGGAGGGAFTDECPAGQVPVGVEGRITFGFYDRIITGYATICGTLSVSGGTVTVSAGSRVPATGGHGGSTAAAAATQQLCPANTVMVGFAGASSSALVSEITPRCAALSITGSAMTGYGIAIGAAANAGTLGTRADTAGGFDCPAGMIARGAFGQSGDVLDAYGLRCGTPSLEIVTTAPTMGGTGGGRSNDDCPAGQVPIGVTASVSAGFYNGILTRYSTQCGTIVLTPDAAGGYTTTITPAGSVPSTGSRGTWGTIASGPTSVSCPANQVVVGMSGTSGSGVNQITLRCAPMIVTGSASAGYAVSYGTITASGTVGTTTGAAFGPVDCPAGMVGSGFRLNIGEILDGIALRCAPPL